MRSAFWVMTSIALVVLAVAAVAYGAVPLSFGEVGAALLGRGEPGKIAIVRTLRAPRVALALLVGAGLGLAGGALQGSLRNALAEPYLLRVSRGAAGGARVAPGPGGSGP